MTEGGARPRPTATGATLAAAGVGGLLAGWSLGYPILSVIGLGALIAVAVSWATLLRRPPIDVRRELASLRVERGAPVLGLLLVSNPGRRPTRRCRAVEHVGERTVRVDLPPLPPGTETSTPYRLPTGRRGAITVGPLEVVDGDPLGLCEARRAVGDSATLWVRPRVYPLEPRPGTRDRHLDGPTSDAAPQGTTTFHALREYVMGDDLRKVHWRTSARTGTLMVRQLTDTSLPCTVVALDLRASRYDRDGDRFEEAVDVAASVVAGSLSRGFPVRLLTTDGTALTARAGRSRPGRDQSHREQRLLDHLAEVRTGHTEGIGALRGQGRLGSSRDALVVVGGEFDAADRAQISLLAQGYGTRVAASLVAEPSAATGWAGVLLLEAASAAELVHRWRLTGAT